jgi:Fe-S-cluster containining protein
VEAAGKAGCFEDHEGYSILRGKPCPFLGRDGRCAIHGIKPLDCVAYPIFIKPAGRSHEWRWTGTARQAPGFRRLS